MEALIPSFECRQAQPAGDEIDDRSDGSLRGEKKDPFGICVRYDRFPAATQEMPVATAPSPLPKGRVRSIARLVSAALAPTTPSHLLRSAGRIHPRNCRMDQKKTCRSGQVFRAFLLNAKSLMFSHVATGLQATWSWRPSLPASSWQQPF
jgi:hypothetical protein